MKIKIGTPDFLKMLNRWNEESSDIQKMCCPYVVYKKELYDILELSSCKSFRECDSCSKIFGLYNLRQHYKLINNRGPCSCIKNGYDKTIQKLNEYGYELIDDKWVYKEML
jgi:hypothetical protein